MAPASPGCVTILMKAEMGILLWVSRVGGSKPVELTATAWPPATSVRTPLEVVGCLSLVGGGTTILPVLPWLDTEGCEFR